MLLAVLGYSCTVSCMRPNAKTQASPVSAFWARGSSHVPSIAAHVQLPKGLSFSELKCSGTVLEQKLRGGLRVGAGCFRMLSVVLDVTCESRLCLTRRPGLPPSGLELGA